MKVLETAVFLVLVPGTVAGVIPWWLRSAHPDPAWGPGPARWLGVGFVVGGTALLLWSAWGFSTSGRGTPAPHDPPKILVRGGPYRVVRNPMYLAVVSIVIGQAVWFGSVALAVYAVGLVLVFHGVVVTFEEPILERKFGSGYEAYRETVPRWLPRILTDRLPTSS